MRINGLWRWGVLIILWGLFNVGDAAVAVTDRPGAVSASSEAVSVSSTSTEEPPTPQPPLEIYGLLLCSTPGFHCIDVKPGETWFSLWPDPVERDIVMRLNRTNVALKYRHWLVVPDDLKHASYMQLSPLPAHRPATGRPLLYIDLKLFAFGAYDAQGQLLYWGPATGGKPWCDNLKESCQTQLGEYQIYRIQGADCVSSKYPLQTEGGAPMPYCMHYYRGFAVHGSTLSGFTHRSHGCIRLFYEDAAWLNHHFVKLGIPIIVAG